MTNQKRSLLDRVMSLVKPTPVHSHAPPPRQLSDGLWIVDRHVTLPPGLTLPVRMTVIRAASGGLLLHSPIDLQPDVASALAALGPVQAIIIPNSFHYVFAADYVPAYPAAKLYLAPGTAQRVPSLPPGEELTNAPPLEWGGVVDQLVFGPTAGVSEVAFFVRSGRTLLLTDLAFNVPHIDGLANRIGWRLFGVPRRFGPSRSARMALLRDRALVQPFVHAILKWDFQRIIVTHGDLVEADAGAEFRRAFAAYL